MKKMLLATALALLITMYSTDVYCSAQATKQQVTFKNHLIISSFLELGEENCRYRGVAAQNVVKNKNPTNIRKWIARFLLLKALYSAGSICVYSHNNYALIAGDMGNSISA